jgi:hypothetical protein
VGFVSIPQRVIDFYPFLEERPCTLSASQLSNIEVLPRLRDKLLNETLFTLPLHSALQ